jgi:serine/threonine-protein kinase
MAPRGSADADVLTKRREAAAAHLAESVAALEGVRIDLLRLHANASDLAPLATLMDAARLLREDMGRLAEAQAEADAAIGRPLGAERTPTPA